MLSDEVSIRYRSNSIKGYMIYTHSYNTSILKFEYDIDGEQQDNMGTR